MRVSRGALEWSARKIRAGGHFHPGVGLRGQEGHHHLGHNGEGDSALPTGVRRAPSRKGGEVRLVGAQRRWRKLGVQVAARGLFLLHGDVDPALLGRVARGVVEHVRDHLAQPRAVAHQLQGLRGRHEHEVLLAWLNRGCASRWMTAAGRPGPAAPCAATACRA